MKKLKSILYRVEEKQISRTQLQQKHYVLYFIPIKTEIVIKNNKFQVVYVAIDEEDGDVLCVNTSRNELEAFVMDWFGINPNKNYSQPEECLGFTKINYSEIDGDLEGYWVFEEQQLKTKTRVNLWCKTLNERV
jgi:hypothetical protein